MLFVSFNSNRTLTIEHILCCDNDTISVIKTLGLGFFLYYDNGTASVINIWGRGFFYVVLFWYCTDILMYGVNGELEVEGRRKRR